MWKSFRIKIPLPHPVTPVQAQQDRSPRAMAGAKASLICPHGTSPPHCWILEDMLSLMLERSRGREQIKVASAELTLPGLPGPFTAPSLLKHSHGWHPFTSANKPGVLVQSFPLFLSQLLPLLTERTKSCYSHTQLCHSCVTCTVPAWCGSPARRDCLSLHTFSPFELFMLLCLSQSWPLFSKDLGLQPAHTSQGPVFVCRNVQKTSWKF